MTKSINRIALVFFVILGICLVGCSTGESPVISVVIDGPTSAQVNEYVEFTANVEYNGDRQISYSWYIGSTELQNKTETLKIMTMVPSTSTITVVVTDGVVSATASIVVSWHN